MLDFVGIYVGFVGDLDIFRNIGIMVVGNSNYSE
jgi:hypothetical protein